MVSPGSLWEMQSLRTHPRPTESGSALSQDTQGIQVHIIIWACGHKNQLVMGGGCLLQVKVPRPSMRATALAVLGAWVFLRVHRERAINSANSFELLQLILAHVPAGWKSSLQPPALQVGDGPEKPRSMASQGGNYSGPWREHPVRHGIST